MDWNLKRIGIILTILFSIILEANTHCGCKVVRKCYEIMIETLRSADEIDCIGEAAIGSSTLAVFLQAVAHFCNKYVTLTKPALTYEGRQLYEVEIKRPLDKGVAEDNRPTVVIDAAQAGGSESTRFALFIIEQLTACNEYNDMITKWRWIILPCVNPDGMEYSKYHRSQWTKNLRIVVPPAMGVDITRNFDYKWDGCPVVKSAFSPIYPGTGPNTENETLFIKSVLEKYKSEGKVYLSIRKNGHGIYYPFATDRTEVPKEIVNSAAEVAAKVNQRAGNLALFLNSSLYEQNGEKRCGHSVDYAYDLGYKLPYEYRLFMESDFTLLTMFQPLPRGFTESLRSGYFNGIRELFQIHNYREPEEEGITKAK